MAQRWRGVSAVLVFVALGVTALGCTSTVSGQAAFGPGVASGPPPTGGGLDDDRSPAPSGDTEEQPSSAAPTAASPTASSPAAPATSSDQPVGSICRRLSPAFLRSVFGTMPKLSGSAGSEGCTFEAGDVYVIINELPTFTVTQEKQKYHGTDLTVAGHPGTLLAGTEDGYIVVSESHNPSAEGVLKAYTSREPAEHRASLALLTKLVPMYAKG